MAFLAATEHSGYVQQCQYHVMHLKKSADKADERARFQLKQAELYQTRVKQYIQHGDAFLKESELTETRAAEASKLAEEFQKKAQEFPQKGKLASVKSKYAHELYRHCKLVGQEKKSSAGKREEKSLFYQQKSKEMGVDTVAVGASGAEMRERRKWKMIWAREGFR